MGKGDKIFDIISKKLDIEKEDLTDSTAFHEVKNWDSFKHLEMISAIEKEFKIKFDMDEITSMENIGKIKKFLKKHGIKDL